LGAVTVWTGGELVCFRKAELFFEFSPTILAAVFIEWHDESSLKGV
jgi:hypothetical protein